MRHSFTVRIGPVGFRVGSAWPQPLGALASLYADYPQPHDGIPDFTVRLEPDRPWRHWLRPSVAIQGDYILPEAAPLSLRHGLLAAEMGMNLQMALGQRRFLLLHAATVEREGRALILTGESGAGKSTLAALLGEQGWRLMGDEFALSIRRPDWPTPSRARSASRTLPSICSPGLMPHAGDLCWTTPPKARSAIFVPALMRLPVWMRLPAPH